MAKNKGNKKGENGKDTRKKPSFAEIRKVAKELGIKSVGKEQEALHGEVLDAIAKKFDAGKLKKGDKLLKFYKETADLEDSKDKTPAKKELTAVQKAKAAAATKKEKTGGKKKGSTVALDDFGLKMGSLNSKFMAELKKSPKTMTEIKKGKWNPADTTFYKLFKRMKAKGFVQQDTKTGKMNVKKK